MTGAPTRTVELADDDVRLVRLLVERYIRDRYRDPCLSWDARRYAVARAESVLRKLKPGEVLS